MEAENRNEAFLAAIAGKVPAPTPVTREEMLMKGISDRLTDVESAASEKELPKVTSTDNGKVLGVSGGKWKAVDETKELPPLPTEDGTYSLSVSVAEGVATLSWESVGQVDDGNIL